MKPFDESNQKKAGLRYFKTGCLLFWGCWFALAFLANVFDLACLSEWLAPEWCFRSGNYMLLAQALSIYSVSHFFVTTMFVCDCIVQFLAALLFFLAFFFLFTQQKKAWLVVNLAFMISIALWAVFLIMEEIFIAYKYASVHRELFMLELLTWMSLHLLPGD